MIARPFGFALFLLFAPLSAWPAGVVANYSLDGIQDLRKSEPRSESYGSDKSRRDKASEDGWNGKFGMGFTARQLVSDDSPTKPGSVQDTSVTLDLAGTFERVILEPLRGEVGLILATQPGGAAGFSMRYIDLPALARVYFAPELSLGFGGFAAFPIDYSQDAPLSKRLETTDVGLAFSARWSPPANKEVNWVFEFNMERGMGHVGDAGPLPNHIRNYGAVFGMAAHL